VADALRDRVAVAVDVFDFVVDTDDVSEREPEAERVVDLLLLIDRLRLRVDDADLDTDGDLDTDADDDSDLDDDLDDDELSLTDCDVVGDLDSDDFHEHPPCQPYLQNTIHCNLRAGFHR
jgi:hypothetical protein